jgi:hypothetical protein
MLTVPSVLSDIALPHWIRDAIHSGEKTIQGESLRNLQVLLEKDAIR